MTEGSRAFSRTRVDMDIFENRLTMAQLQSVRISCGFELLNGPMLRTAMKNTLITVSAEHNGEVCGAARVVGDGAFVFFICDVMVDPRFRAQGLGSALILRSLECISRLLPEGMLAPVTLIASGGREDFYRRLGFSEVQSPRGAAMQAFVRGGGSP